MKNLYPILAAWYFFMFYSMGSFFPLISQFLKDAGFNGSQLGTAFGLGALVTIILQPLWGFLSDRYRQPKLLIYLLIPVYTVGAVLIYKGSSVLSITAAYILFMGFFSGLTPVTDSMVVESGIEFGRIRLWGAVGFAIGAQITGILSQNFGLGAIFLSVIASNLAVLIVTRAIHINPSSIEGDSRVSKNDFKKLLSSRKYLLFLMASFLVGGTMAGHNSYFGLLYRELGGSISGIGLAFLLFAGSEAPVMALVQKISAKMSLTLGLLISSLFFALRWYWYSTMPDPRTILVLFLLQGLSIGSFLVLVTLYINEITVPKLRTTALAIYFSFSAGIGGMFTQYFSGFIMQRWDISKVYTFYFISSLIAAILFTLLFLDDRKAQIAGNRK